MPFEDMVIVVVWEAMTTVRVMVCVEVDVSVVVAEDWARTSVQTNRRKGRTRCSGERIFEVARVLSGKMYAIVECD